MMPEFRRLLAALVLAAAACVSPAGADEEGASADGAGAAQIDIGDLPPPAEETCFYSRDIDRFTALSDSFVLVEDRGVAHYLLTLLPGCVGVDRSLRIALISDLQRVCANAAPRIGYDGPGGPETCPIIKIEAVEDRAAAERLVEMRSR